MLPPWKGKVTTGNHPTMWLRILWANVPCSYTSRGYFCDVPLILPDAEGNSSYNLWQWPSLACLLLLKLYFPLPRNKLLLRRNIAENIAFSLVWGHQKYCKRITLRIVNKVVNQMFLKWFTFETLLINEKDLKCTLKILLIFV